MLSEALLKQAAEELALALIEGLPETEQCQHQFSKEFERKMQILLSSVPSNLNSRKHDDTSPLICNKIY